MKENPILRKLSRAIFSFQFVSVIVATMVLIGLVQASKLPLLDIPGLGDLDAKEISKPGEKWLLYSIYATIALVILRWWRVALAALGSAVSAFGVIMWIAYHKVTAQLNDPNLDEEAIKMIKEAIESTELQRGFDYLAIGMLVVFLICRLEMIASGKAPAAREEKADAVDGGEP